MCGFAQRLQPLAMLAAVLETMKMHLKTTLNQRLELEKHVDDSAVVDGARNVETDYMYVIIRRISHISSAGLPLHSPNRVPALQR